MSISPNKELGPKSTNEQKNGITNINDTCALRVFKNELDDYTKPIIFVARTKTFFEAINIAFEYEKNQKRKRKPTLTHIIIIIVLN